MKHNSPCDFETMTGSESSMKKNKKQPPGDNSFLNDIMSGSLKGGNSKKKKTSRKNAEPKRKIVVPDLPVGADDDHSSEDEAFHPPTKKKSSTRGDFGGNDERIVDSPPTTSSVPDPLTVVEEEDYSLKRKRNHDPTILSSPTEEKEKTDTFTSSTDDKLPAKKRVCYEFIKALSQRFPEKKIGASFLDDISNMRRNNIQNGIYYRGQVTMEYGNHIKLGAYGLVQYMRQYFEVDMPYHAFMLNRVHDKPYGMTTPLYNTSIRKIIDSINDRKRAAKRSEWFNFAMTQVINNEKLVDKLYKESCSDAGWKELHKVLEKVWRHDQSKRYKQVRIWKTTYVSTFESEAFDQDAWKYITSTWIKNWCERTCQSSVFVKSGSKDKDGHSLGDQSGDDDDIMHHSTTSRYKMVDLDM